MINILREKNKIMKAIIIVLVVLIVLVALYFLAIMPRMIHRPDFSKFKQWDYAHRGLYDNETDAPENSMKAFSKAVENDYGIELDVQLTRDNVMVVFHDFSLERVCGVDKLVRELTYEELQQLTILDSDQRIPKFEDVLKLVNGRVPLIIEYKIPGTDPLVCKMANDLLADYKGMYCIESFNPMGVLWYRQNRPDVVRGILSDNYVKEGYREYPVIAYEALRNMLFNFIIKPDFIAYDVKYTSDLSRTICQKVYKAPSVAWTAKSQEDIDANIDNYDIFIFEGFLPQ